MTGLRSASRQSTWPEAQRAIEQADAEQVGVPFERRLRRRFARGFPPGVYVLAYHAVVGAEPSVWERAYTRVTTSAARFRSGLEQLMRRLEPARLDELPELLRDGAPQRPRLVVTFDDGYADLVDDAAEICRALGIRPTVFVNADFASGRTVYYRVLVSLLEAEGRGPDLARVLNERLGTHVFSAENLLSETKAWPRPHELLEPILEAWDGPLPRAHLSFDELRELRRSGWSVGNHTRTHRSLALVGAEELDEEILGNERELRDAGLEPLPWLAFPNGRARDVGPAVADWLDAHPDLHGIFGAGGVNVVPTRTEWLRVPVLDEGPAALEGLLRRAADVSRSVFGA